MLWVKIEDTLPDHPKVYELAERLDIDPDAAVGKLIRLWTWMANNRPDGTFKKRDVPRLAMIANYPQPEKLLDALIGAELVDETEDGFVLHDWNDYTGAFLKEKEQAKERKRRSREKAKTIDEMVDVTAMEESAQSERDCHSEKDTEMERDCHGIREEKRREEIIKDDDDAGSRAREANVDYSLIRLRATEHFTEAWGRKPTNAEMAAAVRWYCMGTPEELIWEAYRRAAMAGAKNAFSYAASCIDRWEHEGIASLEALIETDFEREKKRG